MCLRTVGKLAIAVRLHEWCIGGTSSFALSPRYLRIILLSNVLLLRLVVLFGAIEFALTNTSHALRQLVNIEIDKVGLPCDQHLDLVRTLLSTLTKSDLPLRHLGIFETQYLDKRCHGEVEFRAPLPSV